MISTLTQIEQACPFMPQALIGVQACIGLLIVVGGFLILQAGSDKGTPWPIKAPMIGLVAWGAWFGGLPLEGHHDSLAANALAGLVAYVLIRYGRQVRGILASETWWVALAKHQASTDQDKQEVHP